MIIRTFRNLFTTLVVIIALLINAFGQEPQSKQVASPQSTTQQDNAPATKVQEERDDVVRITTNLVQVDATVTDRSGKQVNNLTADDFEITENGKPQKITNFSYISTAPQDLKTPSRPPSSNAVAKNSAATTPFVPTKPLRPEQVHRAIALVVDDLRMSQDGINSTRDALRKYIDQQMQPGDLVAIIRTSAGIGSLQQFTNDRQQLYTAIDHIHQIARVGNRMGAFTSVNMLDRMETQVTESLTSDTENSADRRSREGAITSASQSSMRGIDSDRTESINEFRDTLLTVGTLGALNFVVRGLRELPGRKAVVLFSDGIAIYNSDSTAGDRNARVLSALRQLVDRANRASVVFYAIDTRGLQPTGFTAADSTNGGALAPVPGGGTQALTGVGSVTPDLAGQQVFGNRSAELFDGQNGLKYLAQETGGLAVFNNNDLNRGIRHALDDIGGYYLIGYRPDETTFEATTGRRRYNTWDIKLKNHSDLKIRSRSGFIGVPDDESPNGNRTRTEPLIAALLSPFSAGGINLQLTSFFLNDATAGSTMRSVLYMDANKLTFIKQPDGKFETTLDIVGVTLGDAGQIIDQVTRVEKIRVSQDVLQRFQKEGMIYGFGIPIAKPGAYLLRAAVRDRASGRIGSAGQYIEVPNINGKDHLSLSSLVISGNNPDEAPKQQSATDLLQALMNKPQSAQSPPSSASTTQSSKRPTIVPGGEGMIGTEAPEAGPGSRRFRNKMYLNFACLIYNGKLEVVKQSQITSQVRLFHDGHEVFVGQLVPIDMGQQTDLKRLLIARRLFLGTILEPGDYILHLTITETARSGRPRTATRWLDFRIVDQ